MKIIMWSWCIMTTKVLKNGFHQVYSLMKKMSEDECVWQSCSDKETREPERDSKVCLYSVELRDTCQLLSADRVLTCCYLCVSALLYS